MAMLGSVTIALVMLGLAAVGQPTPKGLANEQLLAAIAAEDESNVGDADALSLLQKEGVYLYRKAPSAAEVPVQRARVQYYGRLKPQPLVCRGSDQPWSLQVCALACDLVQPCASRLPRRLLPRTVSRQNRLRSSSCA